MDIIITLLESSLFLAIVWATCDNPQQFESIPYQPNNPQRDENTVVQEHNKLRRLVAQGKARGADGLLPRASNMANLKWNDALAQKSQELASRCIFEHVIPTVPGFDGVGQNLFIQYSSAQLNKECNYTGAIDSWFDEIKLYFNSQREPFSFTHATGHFTQLVWGDTTDVGCACQNFIQKGDELPFAQIVVCDYGPAGNVLNEAMYKTA